jgi:hypothetical protein
MEEWQAVRAIPKRQGYVFFKPLKLYLVLCAILFKFYE